MKHRIAWSATVVGAIVAGLLVNGAVRSAPSLKSLTPDTLLQNAISAVKAPPAFHGTLQVQSQLMLPPDPQNPTVQSALGNRTARIWHNTPNLWRVETYTSAGSTDSSLTVADGKTILSWNAKTNTYSTRPQPPAPGGSTPGLAQIDQWLTALQGSTNLSLDQNGFVAKRPAYHLVAKPQAGDVLVGSLQVWIDGETFLPLQVELTDRSGAAVLTAGFSDVSFESSAASLFSTQPPAGAQPAAATAPKQPKQQKPEKAAGTQHPSLADQLAAAKAAVSFPVLQPQVLPGGRTLSSVKAHGGQVVLRYGKAWQTLVLVESTGGKGLPSGQPADINGAAGLVLTDRVVSAVSWTAGGVHYTLAGSLDPTALLSVARSVR